MTLHIYVRDATDTDLPDLANRLIRDWRMTGHYGGQKTLGGVGANDTLYLLMHGHGTMPLFTQRKCVVDGEANRPHFWSAEEMAALLESDGLPKTHRDINMLVCHAGESLGDRAIANQLLAIQAKVPAVRKNAVEMAALSNKYATLAAKMVPSGYSNAGQTFPMGAQLFRELSIRGYNNLRIVSYKAPVATYFGTPSIDHPDMEINLELKPKEWTPLAKCPAAITVITKALFKRFGWKLKQEEKPTMLSCW